MQKDSKRIRYFLLNWNIFDGVDWLPVGFISKITIFLTFLWVKKSLKELVKFASLLVQFFFYL